MTEEQGDVIISLLEQILSKLDYIEGNTGDLSYVNSNLKDLKDSVDRIRRNL